MVETGQAKKPGARGDYEKVVAQMKSREEVLGPGPNGTKHSSAIAIRN
jgi:hypothetical protein